MTEHPVCELRHATKTFVDGESTVVAVDELDLTIGRGEFVALMGPSGSGKSTVLNLVGGLDTPSSGDVAVEGHSLVGLSPVKMAELRRRHIGYVFQRLNLLTTLSALENVMLPLELDGVRARDAAAEANDALAAVGLADRASHFPDQLSGGQQQRVAIARALVGQRSLILADEPTGALDTANGDVVVELLARQCEQGRSVLLVTHEPRFAAMADRIVHLRDGRIVPTVSRITLAEPAGVA
jgi:putative ABC transport system ATP-binding protein